MYNYLFLLKWLFRMNLIPYCERILFHIKQIRAVHHFSKMNWHCIEKNVFFKSVLLNNSKWDWNRWIIHMNYGFAEVSLLNKTVFHREIWVTTHKTTLIYIQWTVCAAPALFRGCHKCILHIVPYLQFIGSVHSLSCYKISILTSYW